MINSQWFAHYRGGIEIFKKNKIIGSGFKTFRFECKNDKKKNISCPSHPHNIYIELLSDTGSIGLIIFLILIFLLSLNSLGINYLKINHRQFSFQLL